MSDKYEHSLEIGDLVNKPEMISKKVSLVMKRFNNTNEGNNNKSKLIKQIKESNIKLNQNIKDITSTANCRKYKKQAETISSLAKEMESLENKLETEKAYLMDLEKQISNTETDMLDLKKGRFKIKKLTCQVPQDPIGAEKSKELQQKNLYVASVQLSDTLNKNAELEEKIEVLMSERKKFNEEYNHVLDKLKFGKKVIEDLVISIKNALLTRENTISKLQQLQIKEANYRKLQEQEAFDLQMKKQLELSSMKFNFDKSKERVMAYESKENPRMTMKIKNLNAKLGSYMDIMDNICELTGVENLKHFADHEGIINFIKREDSEITALFNCVIESNHELEVLKENVSKHKNQIKDKSLELEENKNKHRSDVKYLEILKGKIEESKLYVLDDVKHRNEELNKLYRGIEKLTEQSKADVSHLALLLGEKNKVSHFNYLLFLRALETKLISLMGMIPLPRVFISPKKIGETIGKHKSDLTLLDRAAITIPCSVCYVPEPKRNVSGSSEVTVRKNIKFKV